MSYLVLARKYRPRNFSEMVGQEHVVQALTNALTQQRLHHAYLFTGTRGVGKTTVSRILAKSLNCIGADGQGGITAEPCGVCPVCTEIDSGRFPDYIELDAASNRGVDEVQSLLEQAVYKPVQGRFKVFMIDEVHMLTNTAFNAMLKTLEEPPEYLKFVLATTDPQKVPVTVLSRCLQFNLRPMVPETVFEHLSHVLEREHIPFEAQAVRLLARGARGSMRDALSLTDQAIAFGSGQLQEAGVRQMLGAVDRSHVLQLIAALAAGDGRAVVQTVDVLRTHGISAAGTLQELSLLLQRMAVLQAVPGMAHDPSDPDAQQLQALAARMAPDATQLCYSIALQGLQELGWAPDEYAGLTMVLLRPLAFYAPSAAGAAAAVPSAPSVPPTPAVPEVGAEPARAALAVAAETVEKAEKAETAVAPTAQPLAPSDTDRPAAAATTAQPVHTLSPSVSSAAVAPAPQPRSEPVRQEAPAALQTAAKPEPEPQPQAAPLPPQEIPPWMDLPPDALAAPDDYANSSAPALAEPEPFAQTALAASTLVQAAQRAPEAPQTAQPAVQQPSAPEPHVPETYAPAVQQDATAPSSPWGDFWFDCVQQLLAAGSITKLTRELALQAQLLARDEGQAWQLQVASASLAKEQNVQRLASALQAAFACPGLQVQVGPVQDTPQLRLQQQAQARQRRAEEIVAQDAQVQQWMTQFAATIVPGSIRPLDQP